jgi:PAS domain S-box-containing protein/putative nucleotidyltransferase with HDIG domain
MPALRRFLTSAQALRTFPRSSLPVGGYGVGVLSGWNMGIYQAEFGKKRVRIYGTFRSLATVGPLCVLRLSGMSDLDSVLAEGLSETRSPGPATSPLRVLILEDRSADAELMVEELRRVGFAPDWRRVETEPEYLEHLTPTLDLILADYSLPQFTAPRALQLIRDRGLAVPVIVVSERVGEDTAASLKKLGAVDYVPKDRLGLLGPAVHRALDRKRLREREQQAESVLRDSEQRYQALVEHSGDAILLVSAGDGTILTWNSGARRMYGYAASEVIGRPVTILAPPDRTAEVARILERLKRGEHVSQFETIRVRKDGTSICVSLTISPITDARGTVTGISAIARDITARKRAEEDRHRQAHLTTKLVALTEPFHRLLPTQEAVSMIGQGALRLSGADRAAVFMRQGDGTMNCRWAQGLTDEYTGQVLRHQDELPIGRIMRTAALQQLELPGERTVDATRPFLFSDLQDLSPEVLLRSLAQTEGYRALGIWPLICQGQVAGVVGCYYDAPRIWLPSEQEVFTAFCEEAAAALQNAQLYETQVQRMAELGVFYDLSRRLRAVHNVEDMYPILIERAMHLLRADYGAIALADLDRKTLMGVYAAGLPSGMQGRVYPLPDSLAGQVVQGSAPNRTDYVTQDALPGEVVEMYRQIGPAVNVPLRFDSELIGTMSVGWKGDPGIRPVGDTELQILDRIAEIAGTAIHRARQHHNLQQTYIQMVLALAQAIESRNAYPAGHSERMVALAEAIAGEMGCEGEEIQDIRWGARLHDIGKIGIPDDILGKPRPLTAQEWIIMRQHPVIGEEILKSVDRMRKVAKLVRHHQERWDGTGYPDGLQGEAIPLGARILAVVDAFGAITEARPYQKPRTREEAVLELQRSAGTQFDPRVVEVFCQVVDQALGDL